MVDPNSARPSSRDYLEQLRQERQQRRQDSVAAQPVGAAPVTPTFPITPPPSAVPASAPPPLAPEPIVPPQPAAPQAAGVPPSPTPSASPPESGQDQSSAAKKSRAHQESDLFPGQYVPLPEEDVFTWKAPSRPFKKRNRQFYTTVAAIVFLISLILFFAGQFLPIAVVISVAFLGYVLSSVPPEDVEYRLTTYGVRVDNQLHYWEELGRYWFTTKYGQQLLHIETIRFPYRLTLVTGDKTEAELSKILSEVLLKEKPKATFYERAAEWLQEKVPLDTETAHQTPVSPTVNAAAS